MKSWFLAMLMAAVALSLAPSVAEAKRFGGGFSKGMQRSAPAKPAPQTPPSQAPAPTNAAPAAAGAAATGTAAAAGKRSWMGPIAGLAAGLGIAALFSAMGLGEELANFVMIALLVMAAFMAWRFFTRRSTGAGPQLATASAGAAGAARMGQPAQPMVDERDVGAHQPSQMLRTATPADTPAASPSSAFTGLRIGSGVADAAGSASVAPAASLPADFDREAFERLAKMIFIRMQAANDAADVNDLRNFTTPELFADLRLDLQERGPAAQHTDVQEVQAEVLEFAEEDQQQIVSVHYQGTLTEADGEPPVGFDEVWHLVKPVDGSRNWAIAGIQQRQ
jgi:predicted lipid-binding transport protein (Tim44 family)